MSIATKITSIQEHINDIYDTLEIAGADISEVNKNLININDIVKERLIYYMNNGLDVVWENWEKVSESGNTLILNNILEAPISIKLSSSSLEQNTTLGKNKFNKADFKQIGRATYTYSDGIYTIAPNGTGNVSLQLNIDLPAGTYTYQGYANGTTQIRNSSGTVLANSINTQNTFTISEDGARIVFNWATGTSTDVFTVDMNNIQIEEGSSATSYEEYTYGPSPNPDYSQTVHTISRENSVKIQNKNLININTNNQIVYSNSYNNFTLSNGILTTSGNTLVGYKVKVNPNTQYTAQLFGTLTGGTNALRIREFSSEPTDWDTNFIVQNVKTISNNVVSDLTVTTSETTEWILFVIYSNASGLVCKKMQLELGDTATSYVPHKEQTYPISLGDLEYCKIGDYEDLFFKNVVGSEYYDSTLELDKWYLKKNITNKTLTTSDFASVFTTYSNLDYITINKPNDSLNKGNSNDIPIKFTKGTYAVIANFNSLSNISKITSSGGYNVFYYGVTKGTITEEAQNIVDGSKMYYPLATPTYTLLSDTLQTQLDNLSNAISYEQQTSISQTNSDLPFVISATALKNTVNQLS